MTPAEIREARLALGLTLSQLASLLGYEAERQTGYKIESGIRPLRAPQERLLRAYLSGYRPDDWPA